MDPTYKKNATRYLSLGCIVHLDKLMMTNKFPHICGRCLLEIATFFENYSIRMGPIYEKDLPNIYVLDDAEFEYLCYYCLL